MARRRGSTSISALLLVDKPAGWTSHDVVARIRSATGEGRVGHAGTLDPMATGLLVVALGPATRMLDHLQAQTKSYRATVTFGAATTTDDAEGDIVERAPVPPDLLNEQYLREVLGGLVGTHSQVPPAYSAIKVDGKRSYAAARAGEQLDLKPRAVTIEAVRFDSVDAESHSVTFEVDVSKGTYIRAIARDLGVALGTVAHLSALRRINSGGLSVEDALSVDGVVSLASGGVGPLSARFTDPIAALGLPVVVARDQEVLSGGRLSRAAWVAESGQAVSVVSVDGRLLAIYKAADEQGVLIPQTVFSRPVLSANIGPSVVALGVFDGVHLGHAAIARAAVERARQLGVPSVAFTHDPLPEAVLAPGSAPTQLTSLEARIALLERLGIDRVLVVPFTTEIAEMSGEAYIESQLLSRVSPVAAVVGSDFRYGAGAHACPVDLERTMPVTVVNEVDVDGHRARSTDVRRALREGNVTHAARILGRPYAVLGQVVRGQAIGATLGAPTANLVPSVESAALRHGVYAARAATVPVVQGSYSAGLDMWRAFLGSRDEGALTFRDAAVFVGRPTPNGSEGAFAVEAHLLDVSEDLYGQVLAVELVGFLRDPVSLPDFDSLKSQIADDLLRIRSVLNAADLSAE